MLAFKLEHAAANDRLERATERIGLGQGVHRRVLREELATIGNGIRVPAGQALNEPLAELALLGDILQKLGCPPLPDLDAAVRIEKVRAVVLDEVSAELAELEQRPHGTFNIVPAGDGPQELFPDHGAGALRRVSDRVRARRIRRITVNPQLGALILQSQLPRGKRGLSSGVSGIRCRLRRFVLFDLVFEVSLSRPERPQFVRVGIQTVGNLAGRLHNFVSQFFGGPHGAVHLTVLRRVVLPADGLPCIRGVPHLLLDTLASGADLRGTTGHNRRVFDFWYVKSHCSSSLVDHFHCMPGISLTWACWLPASAAVHMS